MEVIKEWSAVHEKYQRAINPLMSLLDIRDSNVESQLVQACIGLEGLGVQLDRDNGVTGRRTLEQRLDSVVNDVGFSFSADWASRTAKTYNDLKHYDRDQSVDPLDIYNTLQECELMFRAWAGLRIGLKREHVISGLESSNAAQSLLHQSIITVPS